MIIARYLLVTNANFVMHAILRAKFKSVLKMLRITTLE